MVGGDVRPLQPHQRPSGDSRRLPSQTDQLDCDASVMTLAESSPRDLTPAANDTSNALCCKNRYRQRPYAVLNMPLAATSRQEQIVRRSVQQRPVGKFISSIAVASMHHRRKLCPPKPSEAVNFGVHDSQPAKSSRPRAPAVLRVEIARLGAVRRGGSYGYATFCAGYWKHGRTTKQATQ